MIHIEFTRHKQQSDRLEIINGTNSIILSKLQFLLKTMP